METRGSSRRGIHPRLLGATLVAVTAVAVAAAQPAVGSLPGVVDKHGIAVCWKAGDYRYSTELARAARLWNAVAGRPRIWHASEGCIPNFRLVVDVTGKGKSVQGETFDGAPGYMGEIVLYKSALDHWPKCRKWIALHEFGHALGLQHDRKYRTIMHAQCPATYGKPVSRPTRRDIAQYTRIWANGPRGYESDPELAAAE
jgi:matrixin